MRMQVVVRAVFVRAREVISRRRIARELDEELQFHLEHEIEYRVAQGESPAEARRAAALAFGGVQRFREEALAARGFAWADDWARDVRFAVRRLRRAPAFTLGAVATLAVALGAGAAITALVYDVMLRPLPYRDADRLVRVDMLAPGLGITTNQQSPGTFVFVRERARAFSALGAYMENEGVAITDGAAPERVRAALLTPNLLGLLGVTPVVGRLLTDDDAAAGFTSPVLISFELWQRRFGGDPSIVGRFIELNRGNRLVAGVLPAGFDFPNPRTAIYYPERIEATRADLASRYLTVVARLAPGVSVAAAQRELDALVPRIGERFPELSPDAVRAAGLQARVATLREAIVAPVRSELRMLAALVGLLLLIAVANLATLSLLRAERVCVEVAVTRALGATRGALVRRFVAESLVAALVGGAAAVPIAATAVITKLGFSDAQLPRLHTVRVQWTLIVAIAAAAAVIGIGLGVLMAVRAAATDSQASALRAGSRSTPGRAWRRAQETLVALQIAGAMALVLAAGLLSTSLLRLTRLDIGFSPSGGANFVVQIPFRGYETYQRTAAFDLSVMDALRHTPGVTAVTAVMELPSTPQLLYLRPTLEAVRRDGHRARAVVQLNVASAEFFHVMRIPLRAGRSFASGDLAAANPGVVLGATLARELFGSEDPIGHEVHFASGGYPSYRVVGVAGDVYGDNVMAGALRSVYFPLLDDLPPTSAETEDRVPVMPGGMHFVVRSTLPLTALAPAFRRAVNATDPRVPLWDVRTLDDVVSATTARLRMTMLLLALAGAGALLLGVIGISSVIAYATAGRAPEFAIRLALGDTPIGISRHVCRQGMLMIVAGVVSGAALSIAGARLLRGLLYEVSPTDPRIYAPCIAAVGLLALLAMYLPARRAGATDPATVLRT